MALGVWGCCAVRSSDLFDDIYNSTSVNLSWSASNDDRQKMSCTTPDVVAGDKALRELFILEAGYTFNDYSL